MCLPPTNGMNVSACPTNGMSRSASPTNGMSGSATLNEPENKVNTSKLVVKRGTETTIPQL